MYWLFKLLIRNKRRRGLVQYWWTGRSYPIISGFKARRRRIWEREVRDGVPFEGSVFWACVKTVVNGKLSSWRNLFRMSTWNRLFGLMAIMKKEKDDED